MESLTLPRMAPRIDFLNTALEYIVKTVYKTAQDALKIPTPTYPAFEALPHQRVTLVYCGVFHMRPTGASLALGPPLPCTSLIYVLHGLSSRRSSHTLFADSLKCPFKTWIQNICHVLPNRR
eukprot:243175-Pleurochrysis_carterae.AAC.1